MSLDPALRQRLSDMIASDRVVLFMKGTRHFPQCGFSATVTQILNGLVKDYTTVNVLTDPAVREGIKAYSEWPTIPQLYVDGKFIGGCDIVRDMFQAGELQSLVGAPGAAPAAAAPAAPSEPPKVTITDAAKRAVNDAKGSEPGMLRLEISPSFEHALSIDEAKPNDVRVDAGGGFTLLIDPRSAPRASGVRIDYHSAGGGGFAIDNPNEPPKVRQLSVEGLQSLKQSGEPFVLLDVRTPDERRIATIPGDRVLDEAALRELEKDATIVLYCHHGGRSRSAAERLLRDGYTRVHNLAGGIDAWSTIDPTVPRY
jgi:monothiol glutaredoxin